MAEFIVFWIMAVVALGAAISMVLMRNAVHAALMLVINFFAIAVLFAVLEAQFLAIVQVIVYAGAVVVLFLFVLMLLGVSRTQTFSDRIRGQGVAAVTVGVILLVALVPAIAGPYLGADAVCPAAADAAQASGSLCAGLAAVNAQEGGNVAAVGRVLFTDYVLPFEITSVLLVIAALGALVLGRRHEDPADLVDQLQTVEDVEAEEARA
ncbi:MAG TPA: NADH-quinone oxidoreductase subunit J [Egibacteraceae bacterium]|nr:NADH-quinone oxidoreductase subunit J [Egibacteraceae bacterium]